MLAIVLDRSAQDAYCFTLKIHLDLGLQANMFELVASSGP